MNICTRCGASIGNYQFHDCPKMTARRQAPPLKPLVIAPPADPVQLRIAAALERIADALERTPAYTSTGNTDGDNDGR